MRMACLILALVSCDTRHQRCVDNGGRWIAVNCHEEYSQLCQTTDYGNGMLITTCMPMTSTVCDHVCLGASAEARP